MGIIPWGTIQNVIPFFLIFLFLIYSNIETRKREVLFGVNNF